MRRIDEEEALRAVVEGTAAETGTEFYRALVRNLARVLDTHGALITEYDEGNKTLRALAFWFGGEWRDDFEYPIIGTPCETAIEETRLVHIPDRILDLYPSDNDFKGAGVVSYLGVPLLSRDRLVLGHLAVVDVRPMPAEKGLLPLFQIFANRAVAEMRRLRLEGDLRERQEKLGRLVDSAMDAIVELDGELCITLMNAAAEKVFGETKDRLRGQSVERLLGTAAKGKLGGHIPGWPEARIALLDHVGARTGKQRTSPVMYLEAGDSVVVMASKAGQPTNPAWFHNLMARPDTTVQTGPTVRQVHARVAGGEERIRLWSRFVEMYPGSEFYRRNATGREIPIVALDPR